MLPSPEWKMKRFRRPEQQRWYRARRSPSASARATTPTRRSSSRRRWRRSPAGRCTGRASSATSRTRALASGAASSPSSPAGAAQARVGRFRQARHGGVNKEGTGARAFAKAEYTSGGKTGTAQVIGMKQNEKYDEAKVAERHRDHSLFIAFAPLDKPIIALAVIVENGGFGARAAAPMSRTVLDYYLVGKLPPGCGSPRPRTSSTTARKATDGTRAPSRPAHRPSARRRHRQHASRHHPALSMLGFAALFSASYDAPGRVLSQLVSLGIALVAMWITRRSRRRR